LKKISNENIILINVVCVIYPGGSRFTTGLRSPIFGCKPNRRKTSTIQMV